VTGLGSTALLAFEAPHLDYHALAPEIVLAATFLVVFTADLIGDRFKPLLASLTGIGLLAALVPVLTLGIDDAGVRSMFGGGYVIDDFSLILKGLFVLAAYVVVLLSTNYVAEGDYWEGEYYLMVIASTLGMVIMASSRDLIGIFVALELLSIPAYMLAAWRKRDDRSNEAGLKYYLMGVFATAVMLYGMSLIFGITGSTDLADIGVALDTGESLPALTLAIVFVVVGFGFKVSAVPFHAWAPDTYEGAPTPITAFLSVSSKAAGFAALISLTLIAFWGQAEVWQPLFWVLSVASMTIGNLIALRQTNIVRLFAYSSVAQGGYILAPLAVAGESLEARATAIGAMVIYLLIYAAMNLGAFAVIIAVARKTRSAEIDSYGGLFQYAPGLCVAMTVFLFALAGIPPLGGWFAKLAVFQALVTPGTAAGYSLAVILGVNSVIALFYYARIAQKMWMEPVPDDDRTPIRVPPSLTGALVLCALVTFVLGVYPNLVGDLGELAELAAPFATL
jgi:NADH-quinone oxidoreductase subunit N